MTRRSVGQVDVNLIRIEGLREFNRQLRDIDASLPTAVRLAANKAAQLIVDDAKPKVPIGPAAGGHASSSIKAKSTRTSARVSGGGKKFPYYGWLDFGGKVGRNNSASRPFLREGRYLWASYSDRREQIQETLVEALSDVAKQAGLDIT